LPYVSKTFPFPLIARCRQSGEWWYNRWRVEAKRTPPKTPGDFKRKYRSIKKPYEEWIGIPAPDSGIPPELIDAARTRIRKNKAPSKNGKRYWELSGNIVRCGECSYVMGTTSSGNTTNHYYYRCRSKYNVKSDCTSNRGVRADVLEREVWETVSSILMHPNLLRRGLKKMIESEKELMSTRPQEQIGRWAEQVERAKLKRSRYQDQEAEGLMTREELRTKVAELDEAMRLAEGEIEKLRCHEERVRAMEEAGEELIERYAKLIPEELQNLSPAERRRIYQTLQISISVPKDGEIKIKLPFPDEEDFCREKTLSCRSS
jgi:hypothetical protein